MVVDLQKSKIDFDEYGISTHQTRAELRKSLQEYLEPRLWIYHRTPESGFDTEWKHTSSLLVSKTVKDMILQAQIDDWSPNDV